jgi:hypothetical protein
MQANELSEYEIKQSELLEARNRPAKSNFFLN